MTLSTSLREKPSTRLEIMIILPAYNESKYLEQAVERTAFCADKISKSWRIVIVEDGSTDGTTELAYKLQKTRDNISVIHSEVKLGRGSAVKTAAKSFDAEITAYLDVDLATDMKHFDTLVYSVKKGCDIVTGSRYANGAVVNRPPMRLIVSKVYNWLIRLWFGTKIRDHQCGFKAFNARVRNELLDLCPGKDWTLDTEVLVLATKKGYRILEFPVTWVERRSSKTPTRRLIKDIGIHWMGLLKLSWTLSKLSSTPRNLASSR